MVVRVGINEHASLHSLVAEINPRTEFIGSVENRPVPSHRLRFDGFTVTEPADIRPVSRNGVELQF